MISVILSACGSAELKSTNLSSQGFEDRPHSDDEMSEEDSLEPATEEGAVASLCELRDLTGPIDPNPSEEWVRISNPQELSNIRNNPGGNFILMNDIDLSGFSWEPIGTWSGDLTSSGFRGVLDGNGFEIRNLSIQNPEREEVALFAYSTGSFKNLVLRDFSLDGKDNVGALAAVASANFTNIHYKSSPGSTGSIEGQGNVGALIGHIRTGNITDVTVDAIVSGGNSAGGIVGRHSRNGFSNSSGKIETAYATGNITGSGSVGGIAGSLHVGDLFKSCANTEVNGGVAGGLIGSLVAPYRTSVGFSGSVDASPTKVRQSYATGKVLSTNIAGGLIGQAMGSFGGTNLSIQNSYSNSEVSISGASSIAGGLLGTLDLVEATDYPFQISIQDSYSTSLIDGSQNLGGFIGEYDSIESGPSFISNSFYLSDLAANENLPAIASVVEGELGSQEIAAVTGDEMASPENFLNANWSEEVWCLTPNEFPRLTVLENSCD